MFGKAVAFMNVYTNLSEHYCATFTLNFLFNLDKHLATAFTVSHTTWALLSISFEGIKTLNSLLQFLVLTCFTLHTTASLFFFSLLIRCSLAPSWDPSHMQTEWTSQKRFCGVGLGWNTGVECVESWLKSKYFIKKQLFEKVQFLREKKLREGSGW